MRVIDLEGNPISGYIVQESANHANPILACSNSEGFTLVSPMGWQHALPANGEATLRPPCEIVRFSVCKSALMAQFLDLGDGDRWDRSPPQLPKQAIAGH